MYRAMSYSSIVYEFSIIDYTFDVRVSSSREKNLKARTDNVVPYLTLKVVGTSQSHNARVLLRGSPEPIR